MQIITTADNRRAYRIKAIRNKKVLYDVAFNPDSPNDLDVKFGGDTGETVFNLYADVDTLAVRLARQGAYFGAGKAAIIAAGFSVQQ